ncbi:NAD-dependent succinate-semialdehyde dehydrogenase [Brucellaceae bacterium C25G]
MNQAIKQVSSQQRERRHHALDQLHDHSLLRELSYANGRWITGNEDFEVCDPATGQPLARVTSLNVQAASDAITAAHTAFPAWSEMLPQQRGVILRQWAQLIRENIDDLALIMTLEQGKPLAEARGEIEYAASFPEWYAEEGKRLNSESVTSHLLDAEMIVRREPLGVAALITPWNFPSAMLTRKAAAALAAGCTVVAHPSSETPLSALALAELAERAGMPAGVFNIITGDSASLVGALCDDNRVSALSFTGSTAIGRLIATRCASSMKRLIMELGGHAPLIIFDDANIDQSVKIVMDAKFATSGQDCLAANRIYVHRSIATPFLELLKQKISQLRTGSGLHPETDIGPLMHERAIAKVDEQVRDALNRGAQCLIGGKRDAHGSLFYSPTLLCDVPDDAQIMREETFGPVAAVTIFDTEDQVIQRANNTEYGLVAYIVTENGARQWRMGRALQFGMVAINRVKITGGPIPFGGWKQSGLGREGSRHGMEAFTELKYLCIDTAAKAG